MFMSKPPAAAPAAAPVAAAGQSNPGAEEAERNEIAEVLKHMRRMHARLEAIEQKQEAAEIEGEEPASSRSRAASSTM